MMEYKKAEIRKAAKQLKRKFEQLEEKRAILRDPTLLALFERIKTMPAGKSRAEFGSEVNTLKKELKDLVARSHSLETDVSPIDVTAPFDINISTDERPRLLPTEYGSQHPLTTELEIVLGIFSRMGFTAVESREIDDDFHMFSSLNFPPEHPARDDYDTFVTDEDLIAPAHTSTMQNRVLKQFKSNLKDSKPIAVVLPGRVFRNEDVDARHEHTFHQFEGVYVDEGIHAGHLIATFQTFLQEYYQQKIEVRLQPFYFPFTEPSFEMVVSCPFCNKKGCQICSYVGWIELLGMGMIHPNVLKMAGIDPEKYTGFAWGCGLERLVMMKYNIEDIRHFHSGNLAFLRQFS